MKLQSSKILEQQSNIERISKMLQALNQTYTFQKNAYNITLFLLLVVVIFGAILLFLLREKQLSNKVLAQQNLAISQQKEEIETVSAQFQQAVEDKMKFYSYVSHEFKTPLSLILTPAEDLLQRKTFEARESRKVLELISKNANRLLRLVNQILDLRQVDSKNFQLNTQTYDLVHFIREIVNDFALKAKQNHIDLQFISPFVELNYDFDAEKFDKVLFNIISNAFKYTAKGGRIHVSLLKNIDSIEIIIVDNGVGMNEHDKEHAFDLFYRAGQNLSFGSGLGLTLSKEYVQLHQGNISVESQLGKGTAFKIQLPYFVPTTSPRSQNLPHLRHDIDPQPLIDEPQNWMNAENSILIIEDNHDLIHFLHSRFSTQYTVYEADSAEKGWEIILKTIPDLIISDVMLPGMDGFTLTHQIKEDFRTSHIPIILLTAKGRLENQIEGEKSGADAYISKPFNQQLLEEKVKNLLENRDRMRKRFSIEVTNPQFIQNTERKFLNDFELLLEKNLKDGSLSVQQISREMGMSRVQLYRKITALTNKNVNDYIAEFKLKKAKQLLSNPEKNIAEIAYELGFSNPGYFTTFFKSKTELTPSNWRAQNF